MSQKRKQHILNEITDILGLPRWVMKRPGVKDGSSVPSHVFRAAALQVGVGYSNMPATNERILLKAGLPYLARYDSQDSDSKGGGTVTKPGLTALREALIKLVGPVREKNGFLLTWNPDRWQWPPEEFAGAVDGTARGQIVKGRWSMGSRTSGVKDGDRAFLLRQGGGERGLVASGTIRSSVFVMPHYSDPARLANYVEVEWEVVLAPDEALPTAALRESVPMEHRWEPRSSGTAIPRPDLAALEQRWLDHLGLRQKAWQATGTGSSGQARQRDALRRKAIENAAQEWLMEVYADAGWYVEDTHIGNPFDARATKDGLVKYLEAKGTQSAGETVIVTRNEIAHAGAHPGECVIGIWSGIRFEKSGTVDLQSGTKTILDWTPRDVDLDPIAYDWRVGGPPSDL